MKELSRSKKTFLNTIMKFIYQVITIVVGLIIPRLIIQTYGSSYNGVISSITQFLSVCSILAMGIAGAMRTELYKTLASNDIEGTSKIVKCTRHTFSKIGKIFICYAVLLAIFYPLFARGQIDWFDTLLLVIILAITTFSEYYLGQTYYFLLEADQAVYVVTAFRIIVQILSAIFSYVLIGVGASIVVVKAVAAVLMCSTPFIIRAYALRKYKINRHCELDKTLLRQRKASMFHSVANIIHDRTGSILLTLFTDFKTISVYTVFYSVVGNIKVLMQNFLTGLEAGFGNMWAKGEKELYKRHFKTYEFIVSSFVSIIFTCLAILLIPFIRLYTIGIQDANYVLPVFGMLVVVAEAFYCFRQPYTTAIQSVGHYKQTKHIAAIEAGVNLVTSLILVIVLGLNGVIIGTIVANLYRTLHYGVYASKNILERNFVFVIFRILWSFLNMGIVILIYKLLIEGQLLILSWGDWVLHGVLVFGIATVVTILTACVFYRKDLFNMLKFVKNIFKR